jgi:hypothetical protein
MIRYFVKYSVDGQPIATNTFIDSFDEIPTDQIEVTKDKFDEVLQGLGDVSLQKTMACQVIDKKAGDVRLRFITSVPGQAETYIMKADEAKKIKALNYNLTQQEIAAQFPVVHGEMLATGANIIVVCETILATEAGWKNIAAAIEKERRQGKISIDACTNMSEIQAQLSGAIASLDAIR